MRVFVSILAVLALTLKLSADEASSPTPLKIGMGEADKHYDQEMVVRGRVAQVTLRPKVVLLNFDRPYPDSPFTAVKWAAQPVVWRGKNLWGRKTEYEKNEIARNRRPCRRTGAGGRRGGDARRGRRATV